MLCEKVLGTLKDAAFAGKTVDYVKIEWHEAFKKLHKKVTEGGTEIGMRLGNEILTVGLHQDDVLYADDSKVIAVNIPPCEAIIVTVAPDHPHMACKVCYEIGNKHASLFWGNEENEFITPYNEPTLLLLQKLHGVTVRKDMVKLDFEKAISFSVNAHTH